MKPSKNISNIDDIGRAPDCESRDSAGADLPGGGSAYGLDSGDTGGSADAAQPESPLPDVVTGDKNGEPLGDGSDREAPGGIVCPRQNPERCGHINPLGNDSCQVCGCVLPGNRRTLRHGRYARRENLPADLAQIDQAANTWTAQVLKDQGGADLPAIHAGAIRTLGGLEYMKNVLVLTLKQRGLTTKRGGIRSEYTALLATLDRWLRFATLLGIERKQKAVNESPREWLERIAHEKGEADDTSTS